MKICKNCNTEVTKNYCSVCGNPVRLTRINGQYIVNEIGSVLNFEKGLFFTIRELILRPGTSVKKFIQEDRNRLIKPIIFLILSSLIYSICQQILHFEDGYVNANMGDSSITRIFEWIQQNYGYANIFMGVFMALWIKVFFRKSGFNIYEILILIFFITGIGMLIYTVFGIAESLTKLKVLHLGGIIGSLYFIWAIGQFFDRNKAISYVKGFFSYFLGWLTSTLFVIIIGLLIDLITKSS